MAEGAALEMLYTLIAYRGFESLPLLQKRKHTERCVSFFIRQKGFEGKSPLPAAEEGLLSGVLTESLPLLQKRKHTERCVSFFIRQKGFEGKSPLPAADMSCYGSMSIMAKE